MRKRCAQQEQAVAMQRRRFLSPAPRAGRGASRHDRVRWSHRTEAADGSYVNAEDRVMAKQGQGGQGNQGRSGGSQQGGQGNQSRQGNQGGNQGRQSDQGQSGQSGRQQGGSGNRGSQ